ncbi:hypothetical protein NZK35_23620 [Stieleria sp. ICT_E10.1]|uniref:hypothetical protein n=1 Tax=Stieleria sedimenti TaxID=2976331 RepID=UPI00217F80D7|nr:hypothetical protein [Stieleria sedimenti]MCS7469650.1 hypothetical protein [Stieleria sedimenti]
MNLKRAFALSCAVVIVTLAAVDVWNRFDRPDRAVQPEWNARPVGRRLTDFERGLSQQQTRELKTLFPDYHLPLDQDRRSRELRQAIERDDHGDVERLLLLDLARRSGQQEILGTLQNRHQQWLEEYRKRKS